MEEFVWLHDSLIPRGQARVSVEDRGFLYGDGLFETLRSDAGQVHLLDEHLARLRRPFSGCPGPGRLIGGSVWADCWRPTA